MFYDGTDTGLSVRHSMDAYLDRAASCALMMAEEAELILGDTDAVSRVAALADAVSAESMDSVRASAYRDLLTEVESLYTAVLAEVDDPEQVRLAYNDFKSAANLVKNDAYSGMARAFNREKGGFPAGLLAGIFGLDDLTVFGG